MYNPRSKVKKIGSPFPFSSYVVKSYSSEASQNVKSLKVNSQKIKNNANDSQQRRHNPSEGSQKCFKANIKSHQILDQMYNLIYSQTNESKIHNLEKYISDSQKVITISEIQKFKKEIQNELQYEKQKERLDQAQQVCNLMSIPNNRKNVYRTRQHKPKSLSPQKAKFIQNQAIIVSFRYNIISLYSLFNRREDYLNILKNKFIQSLYPPLKSNQIQEILKKYMQTKGRDKGRIKYNYLTSQQLRSLKYKPKPSPPVNSNKKKQKNQDQYDEEEDDDEGQQKPQLVDFATWKRKNGVGQNQKVFIVKGGYSQLRRGLIQKGWYQNEDVWSPYFDFKWTTKIGDIDYMTLRPHQTVNHFNNNQHLTSKYGITRRLKTLYLSHQVDIDKFYPRCFDLADLVDFQNFIQNFKLGFLQTVCKRFIIDKKRYQNRQLKIRMAYELLKKNLHSFHHIINDLNKCNFNIIKPQQWSILTQTTESTLSFNVVSQEQLLQKLKQLRKLQQKQIPANFEDQKDFPLLENSKSISNEQMQKSEETAELQYQQNQLLQKDAQKNNEKSQNQKQQLTYQQKVYKIIDQKMKKLLSKLQKNDPQYEMNGYRNVWIAKPNFMSRGRGIRCYNNLYDIITYCLGGTGQFVVQKYIQNPLLIQGKKFDIRQWVLIQDYNPPKIWFYDECYVRFCADQYSLDDIRNRFQHLTNNSIQKYNKKHVADKSMWYQAQFIQFIGLQQWKLIQQKLKNIVVWTIKSCEGYVNGRKGNTQLVGYDFMIDQNLNPWLIQINMSPSMQYSTPVTKKLVKMVLNDTAKVIASTKKTNQIGSFKCIYKGNQDLQRFNIYKI